MKELLYAVKIEVQESAAPEWEDWMRTIHIPDVLKTGLFRQAVLMEDELSPAKGLRYYEVHYITTQAELEEYQNKHASRLQSDHATRYEGKVEAQRRILALHDIQKA